MAHLNLVILAILVLVVVVVVIIVAGYLSKCKRDKKHSSSHSISHSSSSDSRHHVHAANKNKPSNYKEVLGPVVEAKVPVKSEQQPEDAQFPRVQAQASRPEIVESEKPSSSGPTPVQNTLVRGAQDAELVKVPRMAELFSPKRDVLAELGVTPEEFEAQVAAYQKKHEYRERAIPVSHNFNLDAYKDSKKVLRESAKNAVNPYGHKKGNIVANIYKTYGKNLTKTGQNRHAFEADVPSLISNPTLHARQKELAKDRTPNGTLVAR
jgi:uncharacterized protein (UPF0333 family)